MKAVIFDLDDTLYPEIEFVKSGFKIVAHYLGSKYHLIEEELSSDMLDILQKDGRGKVFDTLLSNLGIYSEDKVRLLLYLYRSHQPTIFLYEDVLPLLEHLKHSGVRLGILTDGMGSVQESKVSALGLGPLFDTVIFTDKLGRENWKPSTVPYQVALELLGVSPSDAAYVGDNPTKDFIAPNSMGMVTIQVMRQTYQNSTNKFPPDTRPGYVVRTLSEILPIIEREQDERR